LPDLRLGACPNDLQFPTTTYRLVIRQPLIEILAADHPCDYHTEKRAEYFRQTGGLVKVSPSPRLNPKWPKMVISCDLMALTAKDSDNHFDRLKRRLIGQYSPDEARTRFGQPDALDRDALLKVKQRKEAKTADIRFVIEEALFTFVSEPVELNVGIKFAKLQLALSNYHFTNSVDSIHRIVGSSSLDTLTCSTRLEDRYVF